jgi:hypothetical protein
MGSGIRRQFMSLLIHL